MNAEYTGTTDFKLCTVDQIGPQGLNMCVLSFFDDLLFIYFYVTIKYIICIFISIITVNTPANTLFSAYRTHFQIIAAISVLRLSQELKA